ncbi:peptidoglycan DD-metalloendopeptidase family protein [Pseudomonas sp. P66]|jgi:murein DD-endopeptidase MepM/ murein hydrolase activator NlpD|uniref:Peptidoglycan DD-metalloendopeptidase family protein n=1 Tax=Pseudomonas arcuscaelestis TaxID=2710591 RepID=A0ABS2BRD6_9PSED|nr:peptidoglycan DD-metalloendopeptidase family protein [Pseudomonas arcuscaelestis]MBM3104830.1 peptidoglycan DD-metalloendopeptidase family protein [Pseudomonas arcuscaelestis]MBM3110080.1 peptidoglycan DD-metalloendopeptidase family protein [Pseudomonas arcuscaelestis]MBM5456192.1 peptidoglycan DD-metalloendopeptidase family protein [Pseudomonas arcuscaelestis]
MPARSLLFCALLVACGPALASTLYKSTDPYGVVSYSDRPLTGTKAFVFGDRMVEQLEGQVKLHAIKFATGVSFSARNDTFAPVEVELRLERLGNAKGAGTRLVRRVVPARAAVLLTIVNAQKPDQPVSYQEKFSYALGNPGSRYQAFRYPLPWRGGPFHLTQGPNGRYSHFGPKGRYAMDIAMPEGTPIIASRAGIVIKTENSQSGRGTHPSGNYVRILHDDGTMGVYLHLMRGSVVVREGQQVVYGTALAKSGNTGNSTGPHLHFVVQRNVGLELVSIPYQFNQPVAGLPNFTAGNP